MAPLPATAAGTRKSTKDPTQTVRNAGVKPADWSAAITCTWLVSFLGCYARAPHAWYGPVASNTEGAWGAADSVLATNQPEPDTVERTKNNYIGQPIQFHHT